MVSRPVVIGSKYQSTLDSVFDSIKNNQYIPVWIGKKAKMCYCSSCNHSRIENGLAFEVNLRTTEKGISTFFIREACADVPLQQGYIFKTFHPN